jgi:hypothetical protein
MYRCPQCGNEDEFKIDAVDYLTAYVTQHLTDTDWCSAGDLEVNDTKSWGSTEWDETSSAACGACDFAAPLWRFEVWDLGACPPIDASEA